MTARTRYFVIASLLVLTVGVGTGLVAYHAGFPMTAFGRGRSGPEELQYVPRDATVLAYADVRDVMSSQLRQKVHEAMPMSENGQREFQDQTGINIETDIEHIVAFVAPGNDASTLRSGNGGNGVPTGGMVLARGNFDAVRIEMLMRDHGAHIEDYKGKRLIVAQPHEAMRQDRERRGLGRGDAGDQTADTRPDSQGRNDPFAVAFIEPRLVAVGNATIVRAAIDQKDGPNVTSNDEMMKLVGQLETGNAWAVGRFDAIQKQTRLPANVASQLPPITWFSISSHVNGGISGTVRAETRDEQSANNLGDVVRGFMALGKLQAGSKPEYQAMLASLNVDVAGRTVALSFSIPTEVFDAMGKMVKPPVKPIGH